MRLSLVHDWEATLATFPYLSVTGNSQVVVRSLTMTIQVGINNGVGVVFTGVEVDKPEVDVQLSCSRPEVQAVLSLLLKAFQRPLQEVVQQQLRQHLLTMLQTEGDRWNDAWWKPFSKVVPGRLISEAITWFGSQIPVEGLPI